MVLSGRSVMHRRSRGSMEARRLWLSHRRRACRRYNCSLTVLLATFSASQLPLTPATMVIVAERTTVLIWVRKCRRRYRATEL